MYQVREEATLKFDVRRAPLLGPKCCVKSEAEYSETGKITLIKFIHQHCILHSSGNCEYCPAGIPTSGTRKPSTRAAAIKAKKQLMKKTKD